jgi:hypothetical protein
VKIASDNLPELRTDRHGSIVDQYQLLALVMLKIQDTCCSSRMVGFCVYHVEEFGLFSYFVFTHTHTHTHTQCKTFTNFELEDIMLTDVDLQGR